MLQVIYLNSPLYFKNGLTTLSPVQRGILSRKTVKSFHNCFVSGLGCVTLTTIGSSSGRVEMYRSTAIGGTIRILAIQLLLVPGQGSVFCKNDNFPVVCMQNLEIRGCSHITSAKIRGSWIPPPPPSAIVSFWLTPPSPPPAADVICERPLILP